MTTNHELIQRAARLVVQSADWEATFYEGQKPVESWALDALEEALNGHDEVAENLIAKYEHAEWDVREQYPDEEDE